MASLERKLGQVVEGEAAGILRAYLMGAGVGPSDYRAYLEELGPDARIALTARVTRKFDTDGVDCPTDAVHLLLVEDLAWMRALSFLCEIEYEASVLGKRWHECL